MATYSMYHKAPHWAVVLLGGFVGILTATWALAADAPTPAPAPAPLALDAAIRLALQQNPEIAAMRQQHGIAAAGVVVARAYPFNPVFESRVRSAFPASAGATNNTPFETTMLLELELRGQGKFRKAAAHAVLTRTDWEIAAQETALAVRVIRAFDTVVYRFQKNQLLGDTLELDRKTAGQAQSLVVAGKLRPADLIILRSEIEDARAQIGQGRTALATAWNDLRSTLGIVGGGVLDLQGDLTAPTLQSETAPALAATAREHRPDRHAREAAVAEAEAALRLEIANRYGNVTAGPTYEFDNSSINNIGATVSVPLPVLNLRRGAILQRQAEKARAALELRQVDVEIDQEVTAALTRLAQQRERGPTHTHRRSCPIWRRASKRFVSCSRAATRPSGRCKFWTCSANY